MYRGEALEITLGRIATIFGFGAARTGNEALLLARILLVLLYLIFGWSKLTDYHGTVAEMAQTGAPIPPISALVATAVECLGSVAIVLGVLTRPVAVLMALYTLATGFIGHHFWTMTGPDQYSNELEFLKNVSITGGFLALYVAGAGRYSLDARLER
jgi:putative oxidoreductase